MYKLLLIALLYVLPLFAQEENESGFGYYYQLDLVSRNVLRGIDYSGKAFGPHVQPTLEASYSLSDFHSFTAGTWSTFGISNEYNEVDLYLKYTLSTEIGSISLSATDYYYPYLKMPFNNVDGNGEGAHTFEWNLLYEGTEDFPISFYMVNLFYNEVPDEKSFYAEMSYTHPLFEELDVQYALGGGTGPSSFQAISADKFQLINLSLKLSKEIEFGRMLFPVSLSYTHNPHIKDSYVYAGIGIARL